MHLSFKTAVKEFRAPVRLESKPLRSLANIDMEKLKKIFKARIPLYWRASLGSTLLRTAKVMRTQLTSYTSKMCL